MRGLTGAGGCITVLARVGLDQRGELFDGMSRERRMDRKGRHVDGADRDWIKVLDRIIRDGSVEAWIRHVAARRHQERIAVGSCLGCAARSDIAARSRDVLDVKLLA